MRKLSWIGAVPYCRGWYKWHQIKKPLWEGDEFLVLLGIILSEAFYILTAYQGISNYLECSSVLRNLALRMVDVQALVLASY